MTTELTYFTVTGYYYAISSPLITSATNAAQFNGFTGAFISFTPRVPQGFTIEITDLDLGGGNTGGAAISLPPVVGRTWNTTVGDGTVCQLSTINTNNTPGIQLLANTTPISTYLAAQGIEHGQLIYDVSFDQVTYAGVTGSVLNFAFAAPTSGTGVCITDPGLTILPYQSP